MNCAVHMFFLLVSWLNKRLQGTNVHGGQMYAGTKYIVAKEGANYLWGSIVCGDQMSRDQKSVDLTIYQIQMTFLNELKRNLRVTE